MLINSNVMRAVGEALEAHHITSRPDEHMSATVARALRVSEADANRWLEALDEGCDVQEANRRAGVVSHKDNESLLNTLARSIGGALGSVAARSDR